MIKKIVTIMFLISFGLIPISMILRIQQLPGQSIFLVLGILGLIVYFTAKTIKDLVNKEKSNIVLQILTVLMSIVLFSKYGIAKSR